MVTIRFTSEYSLNTGASFIYIENENQFHYIISEMIRMDCNKSCLLSEFSITLQDVVSRIKYRIKRYRSK